MRHVVIINGPGVAESPEEIERLADRLRTKDTLVHILGDGIGQVSMNQIKELLHKVNSQDVYGQDEVTIFINTHGTTARNNKYVFCFNDDAYTPAEAFFNLCARIFRDKRIDVFIDACQGGLALPYAQKLAKGSVVASVASGAKLAYSDDPKLLSNKLNHWDPGKIKRRSALNLLKAYLGGMPSRKTSPCYAVSGGQTVFLDKFLAKRDFDMSPGALYEVTEDLRGLIAPREVREVFGHIAADQTRHLMGHPVRRGRALAVAAHFSEKRAWFG